MKIINFLLMIVYQIAMSLLVILAYDKYKIQPRTQKFYVFDSKLVVENKKKELQSMIFEKNQKPSDNEILNYLSSINKIVQYISKRDNVTVILKPAIASENLKDITNEVLQIYNRDFKGK